METKKNYSWKERKDFWFSNENKKELKFYIIENSKDDYDKIFFEENKNSLFSLEQNEIYFNDKINNKKEKISLKYKYISFDKKLNDTLIILLENAKKEAVNIGKERIGEEKEKNGSYAVIYAVICRFLKEPSIFRTIFEFCSALFIFLLIGHKLTNGNKRVCLLFLIGVLRYFGYHFYWTAGLKKNYKYYEYTVKELVVELEKQKDKRYTNSIIETGKWIKKNSVIAIEWNKGITNRANNSYYNKKNDSVELEKEIKRLAKT